jgi:hypothetical protein
MLRFRNTPEFFREFHHTYWEREPVVMECNLEDCPFTLADLFTAAISMPSRTRSDRFWLARNKPPQSRGDFVLLDLDLMGPNKKDGSFAGFFHRMRNHSYGINLHRIELGYPPFADCKEFYSKQLSNCEGFPKPESWDLDTFFGNYRATPFGIHRDPASVFSFCLLGHRTYYTWPMEQFQVGDPCLGTLNQEMLAEAISTAGRFNVESGQVFYWPSNRWHLVGSSGDPFVVAQISAYFHQAEISL